MTMNLPPQADRNLTAQLHGTATRHANKWWSRGEVDEAEHDTAVAELRELAAGRTDLLAEVCGILRGFTAEGSPHEVRDAMAAQLCADAGADETLIPQWVEEGRRRRQQAHARRSPPVT